MSITYKITSPVNGKLIKWLSKNNNKIEINNNILLILTDLNENYYLKSNYNGILKRIINKEDININKDDILCEIFECSHPAIFKNLCVSCGMKITTKEANNNNNNSNISNSTSIINNNNNNNNNNTTQSLLSSKSITSQHSSKFTMAGGQTIRLSQLEAQQTQQNKMMMMKKNKKLALILDLDSTLVHATPFQNFPQEVLKGVNIIQLEENGFILRHLVKLRPYLEHFLSSCKPYFQMTIYTHGTRSYAEATARLIDPNGQYFGKRIVSRTDHPDLGLEKCLSRLFLEDWSMAVVLDDRDDVWRKDQQTHVICIKPYLYFQQFLVNGSRLQQEINNAPGLSTITPSISLPSTKSIPTESLESSTQNDSTLSSSPSSSSSVSSELNSIETQTPVSTSSVQTPQVNNNSNKNNKNNNDNDSSLLKSLDSLLLVHNKYYELLEKGENPNVGDILTSMRKSILKGCNLCVSGLIKIENPRKHKLWMLAESLGAKISLDLTTKTTHLLTISIETEKSRECIKLGNIYVLHPDWLLYCFWHIIKEDENHFLLAPIINKPILNEDDDGNNDNTDNNNIDENNENNNVKKRSRNESETKSTRILQRSNAGVYGVNYNSSSESSDNSSEEDEKPRKIQRMFTNEFKSNNRNNSSRDDNQDQDQDEEENTNDNNDNDNSDNVSRSNSDDVSDFEDDDDWLNDLENNQENVDDREHQNPNDDNDEFEDN